MTTSAGGVPHKRVWATYDLMALRGKISDTITRKVTLLNLDGRKKL